MKMMEYSAGGATGDAEQGGVMKWEDGLPADDDLLSLSQVLIPPALTSAFNVKSEPYRTSVDVDRASHNTLSSLRVIQPNGSRDTTPTVEETDDDRSGSRKISRTDSTEEADSGMRSDNSNSASVSIEDQSARTLKRPRLVWTPHLHKRFVDVVSHLGIKNAVPKTIMQLMNVEGLTRENVASHLQKYRLYLKRMQGLSNEGSSSSDQLFASTPVPQSFRDTGSSGHADCHAPVPFPVLGMGPHHGNGHMDGYSGMDAHHHHQQHGYGTVQEMRWSGNYSGSSSVSYPHD